MESQKLFKEKLVKGLMIILLYFLWPFVSSFISDTFNVNDTINRLLIDQIFNVILMILFIIIYKDSLIKGIKKLKTEKKKSIKTIAIALLLIPIMAMLLYLVMQIIFGELKFPGNNTVLFDYYKEVPYLMIFATMVYYPIVEEIVFKKTIKDLTNSKWLFIILSGSFFWYFNMINGDLTLISILFSLVYLFNGIITSYAYQKTDNLLVPILIRSLYNVFVTISIFL